MPCGSSKDLQFLKALHIDYHRDFGLWDLQEREFENFRFFQEDPQGMVQGRSPSLRITTEPVKFLNLILIRFAPWLQLCPSFLQLTPISRL